MAAPPSWIDEVNARGVLATAAALGLSPGRAGSWGPCPACGADRRTTSDRSDRRGPLGARGDGRGWRCHRCDASGDAVGLVAAVAIGTTRPTGSDQWRTVRDLAALRGLAAAFDDPGARVPMRAVPPPVAHVEAEPERPAPPLDEVTDLWALALPVDEVGDVAAWMRGRTIDPVAVRALDLARAYPDPATLAAWIEALAVEGRALGYGSDAATIAARLRGRAPWQRGPRATAWADYYRAILPTFDPAGELVGIRARWTSSDAAPNGAKATSGAGVRAVGVLADPLGRWLLARGPAARPGDVVALPDGSRAPWDGRVLVVEGEPAYLAAATSPALWRGGARAAVVGVYAGAWTHDHGARIPPAARVVIATDGDDAGERYAAKIGASLTCPTARHVPARDLDELEPTA